MHLKVFRKFLMLAIVFVPAPCLADPLMQRLAEKHIQPGFQQFAEASSALAAAAREDCAPDSQNLRDNFNNAWDAWVVVSHLRIGPTETDNRAFALGFWPDKHGNVPKALSKMLANEDDAVSDLEVFSEVSIAARGFTALEFLIFDEQFSSSSDYNCAFVQAVAGDIHNTARAMNEDWTGDYGQRFIESESDEETKKALLTEVLTAGLTAIAFSKDARLGLPLGTSETQFPKRSEARRSGRSLRHVQLSTDGTGALFSMMAEGLDQETRVKEAFSALTATTSSLNDPVFEGVTTLEGRAAIENIVEQLVAAEHAVRDVVLPGLDLAEGFNALDGD